MSTPDRDELPAMATSRSYVTLMDAGERADLVARVEHFAHARPDLAGRDRFPLPVHDRVPTRDAR